jgi:integrase/recombinase XerD
MLELLYATGLRVSELTSLNIQDLNCEIGFIRCRGDKEERIIPLYQKACELLSRYCTMVRPILVYGSDESALFVNLSGERLSRQGFWKIVKGYAQSAGISKTITPQTLRHSFALHLLENGADIHVLSNMMGHADVSSTQIYNEIIRRKINSSYTNYHPHAAK